MTFRRLVFSALLFGALNASARPGGGHSYSGSSHSSSSSSSSRSYSSSSRSSSSSSGRSYSSSGGGGTTSPLEGACYLLVLVVIIVFVSVANRSNSKGWSTGPLVGPAHRASGSAREQLLALRSVGSSGTPFDPNFSLVLFEDFLYALYAFVQTRRGGGRLGELGAYLSDQALAKLGQQSAPNEVKGIIVGAMYYEQVSALHPATPRIYVRVVFEANYTEVGQGTEQGYYVQQRWSLSRSTSARSRPPEQVRAFNCPSCGAALSGMQGNRCSFCSQVVNTGELDWVVEEIETLSQEKQGPALTSDVEEVGTDLPTLTDAKLTAGQEALAAKDPAFSWDAFTQRVVLVFQELQGAWTAREWARVRPFVSDNLFQTQLYWIDAYRKAKLRNVVEQPQVQRIVPVATFSDAAYDAITVRVFAQSIDYTVRADGTRVSGNPKRPRRYSEYWTFIRGTEAKGRASVEKKCPKCGAPLKVNMAGNCEYCEARVSSGNFDWVLSRIEQDEAYAG